MTGRLVLLFLLILGSGFGLQAQVLEDQSNDWGGSSIRNWFSSTDQLAQWLDLRQFPESYLILEVPAETMVFAGEQLWFYAEADTVIEKKVSELNRDFRADSLKISLLGRQLTKKSPLMQKVVKRSGGLVNYRAIDEEGSLIQKSKSRQEVRDFFVVASLICLFLLAGYKQLYPYIFFSILSPRGLVSSEDFSESGSLQKFFSFDILLFVLMVNVFTSLAVVLGLIFFREDLIYQWTQGTSVDLLTIWMLGAFLLFVFTVIKFIGIRITSKVFDLGRLEFSHFFYLLRLIVWANLVFLTVTFFFLMNDFSDLGWILESSYQVFFWVYLAGIGILFLSMMNKLSFKKYHLFTYLCIAEMAPFLILAKWIMAIGQY